MRFPPGAVNKMEDSVVDKSRKWEESRQARRRQVAEEEKGEDADE